MTSIPQLVTDGFSLGFVVWLTVWGMTIVFRVLARSIGLGASDLGGGGDNS